MTTTEDTPATTSPEDTGISPRHPLDPLTGAEIEAATSILKRDRDLADSARFVYVTLREPAKETVLNHQPGQIPDREADIVLRERAERKTYEATVSITAGQVRHWAELPNVQPPVMLEEFLATEEAVRKDPRWQQAMRRRITNPNRPNGVGEPVAYKLVPQGDSVLPFNQPDSHAIRRAQFATKHLWVTAYDSDQRYPAGDYPNQHPGGDGLPAWTAADRPLENTDLVLWHTFTAHHVVRPEDWPVMPVTTVGFKLRADGFFDGNPALDLPPAEHCHHEK